MGATGPYQAPRTPRLAARLPDDVTQVHSADYDGLERLPPGAVLVVGSGQSGRQIAEDLHLAGEAVERAPALVTEVTATLDQLCAALPG